MSGRSAARRSRYVARFATRRPSEIHAHTYTHPHRPLRRTTLGTAHVSGRTLPLVPSLSVLRFPLRCRIRIGKPKPPSQYSSIQSCSRQVCGALPHPHPVLPFVPVSPTFELLCQVQNSPAVGTGYGSRRDVASSCVLPLCPPTPNAKTKEKQRKFYDVYFQPLYHSPSHPDSPPLPPPPPTTPAKTHPLASSHTHPLSDCYMDAASIHHA